MNKLLDMAVDHWKVQPAARRKNQTDKVNPTEDHGLLRNLTSGDHGRLKDTIKGEGHELLFAISELTISQERQKSPVGNTGRLELLRGHQDHMADRELPKNKLTTQSP